MNNEPIILRPNNPRTESVVKITIVGDTIRVIADYNADRVVIFKGLNYKWRYSAWERVISKYDGNDVTDRIIETAYKLLSENFIVSVPFPELKDRIESGDYSDEQTRWIYRRTAGQYKDWFDIRWKRYKENWFTEAKKLSSAKWSKPSIVVSLEYFEEVLDFAELNEFQFTDGGNELVEIARNQYNQAIRVELKPRKSKKQEQIEEPTFELADELKDDL